MNVAEFQTKIKPNLTLSITKQNFIVQEVVKFKLADGRFYLKCFLSDNYVLADDLAKNIFLLAKEVNTPFKQPFAPELDFADKKFKFLYNAHAVAEEIMGLEIFKKGDSESFWDYQATDGAYLSLGVVDQTNKRLDFYGKIITPNQLNLLTESLSLTLARKYLGQELEITIDRPLGTKHPKHGFIYETNYGFVKGVLAPDGEELDAYYLGSSKPLEQARGVCIAIAHRQNDDDDKLIVVPAGFQISDEQIRSAINFQEKWFKTEIIR
ncbi:MAG: inorganic diphosphatase [Candidatus Buchananbacteria bacterium]